MGDESTVCPHCDQAFASHTSLGFHVAAEHDQAILCPYCGKLDLELNRVRGQLQKAHVAIQAMPCACPDFREAGICPKCSYWIETFGSDIG